MHIHTRLMNSSLQPQQLLVEAPSAQWSLLGPLQMVRFRVHNRLSSLILKYATQSLHCRKQNIFERFNCNNSRMQRTGSEVMLHPVCQKHFLLASIFTLSLIFYNTCLCIQYHLTSLYWLPSAIISYSCFYCVWWRALQGAHMLSNAWNKVFVDKSSFTCS